MCSSHEKIYTVCYLGSILLMLTAGAFTPFIAKSLAYPVFFEKQQTSGIIEEVKKDVIDIKIPLRHRSAQYQKNYFVIDGIPVQVSDKDCFLFEEGDSYPYFRYERKGTRVGDCRNYQLWQGILGLFMQVLIFALALCFIFTETSEQELKKKEKQQRDRIPPSKLKYEDYSTKELYDLCLAEKIHIIPGKRKNREYLIRCLMQEYEHEIYRYEAAGKKRKTEKTLNFIRWAVYGFVTVQFMRHIYYLLNIFTK